MMKKMIRLLTLALALMMLALPVLNAAAEGSDEVLAQVNGDPITRGEVEEMFGVFVDYYGEYYDLQDPEVVAMFWEASMDYEVQQKLIYQKAAEMGLLPLTSEDYQQIDTQWEAYVQSYVDYYGGLTDEATEDEKLAARNSVLAMMEASGVTEDKIRAEIEEQLISEKVEAEISKDLSVTEEELQAHYEALVSESRSSYEQSPLDYIQNSEMAALYSAVYGPEFLAYLGLDGSYYYQPEGYRGVIHILLEADEALLTDYQNKVAQREEQLEDMENGELASGTDLVSQEDVDAAYAAVLASVQSQVDEINARLANGESFEALIAEYGKDPGMENEETLASGYSVHLDSVSFDPAFVAAAFSVDSVGDVAAPVVGNAGVHIVKYLRDVPAGPVELTDEMKAQFRSELLNAKESENYSAVMNGWVEGANIEYFGDGQAMADNAYTVNPLSTEAAASPEAEAATETELAE